MAYPRRTRQDRLLTGRIADVLAQRGTDVLLAVALAVLALVLLSEMTGDFNVDSWLALVSGRLVWEHGIPQRETLTVMSQGQLWVDQQWLSQLATYALYRLGGLGLLGVVNVALIAVPVAAATFAARSLGAPFRSVLLTLPACLTMVAPAREIRTQEFAIPLFVATAYLLATDGRRPSRRVFWCLPMLVLWANLHGSVTLGAGLVALRGLTVAWERRRDLLRRPRAWLRPLALILGPLAAILVTPYGLSMVGYYHATMVDSTLRHYVTEWEPITSAPVTAVALFLVAGLALWSFGRNPDKTTLWEKLALLVLIAGSISVVRNALFCGLFSLMIVPVSWAYGPLRAAAQAPDRRRVAVNGMLALATACLLVAAGLAALARPDSAIEAAGQRPGVLAAVERATRADPTIRVLADDHFSDWLLWRDPALSGRVANDVRFELLTAAQLSALQDVFAVVGTHWQRAARGYRLIVLLRSGDGDAAAAFEREPGSRVLYSGGPQLVILRSARAAERG